MYLIELVNNNLKKYDKYTKVRFNLNDNLPLKQELEVHNIVIIIRSVFIIIDQFIHKYF